MPPDTQPQMAKLQTSAPAVHESAPVPKAAPALSQPPTTACACGGGCPKCSGAAAKPQEAALPVDTAARDEIKLKSMPQNAGMRKIRYKDIRALYLRAGIRITDGEIANWVAYGNRHGNPKDMRVPSNFDEVKNSKVVEQWNAQMAALDADAPLIKPEDVTTSGDGFIINSGSTASGPKGPVKRAPIYQQAFEAIRAYDKVDRTRLNAYVLFSDKQKDKDLTQSMISQGAFVEYAEGAEPPVGSIYVLGTVWRDGKGRVTRQFLGNGIVVNQTQGAIVGGRRDETVRGFTTMKVDSLNAITEKAIQEIQFSMRTFQKNPEITLKPQTQLMGWFVPDKLAAMRDEKGESDADTNYADAYEMTNKVTRDVLRDDEKADSDMEARRFALSGNDWMGADWHGGEGFGYSFVSEHAKDKDGNLKYKMRKGKQSNGKPWDDPYERDKDGHQIPVMEATKRRKRVTRAVAKGGNERQQKAYKIYAGNPDKVRYPDLDEDGNPTKFGSYFTTCVETATKILTEYGINPAIFGGLMASVNEPLPPKDPKQAPIKPQPVPRQTAIFKYLKEAGAWVWAADGESFVPNQGDVFLTGTYTNSKDVRKKTYGRWEFQHTGVIVNKEENPDGSYTLLSQDGGKGMAALGEDKTGYTMRNYNPITRIVSGAADRTLIGVWRPVLLKAALARMPREIFDTLSDTRKAIWEQSFGKRDVYD